MTAAPTIQPHAGQPAVADAILTQWLRERDRLRAEAMRTGQLRDWRALRVHEAGIVVKTKGAWAP